MSDEDGKLLFGEEFDVHKVFHLIDQDTSGEVFRTIMLKNIPMGQFCRFQLTIDEFLSFMQKKGVSYHAMLLGGCSNAYIDGFTGYLNVAFRTLQRWSDRIFSKV